MDRRRLAVAATLIFVALNLRMAIAAVPPVLTQIQDDTGLGSVGSGLLTALPIFCFGAIALSTPALVRRLRMGPLLGLTMGVVAIGCAVRLAPSVAALFLGTAIVGSGIAVANVLLPGLIKRDFADRAGTMIAFYALALSFGATIPAGLTIPVEDLTGAGWRPAVAVWGIFAVLALVLWLPRARRDEPAAPAVARPSPARDLRRDRIAWAVTFFMGLQSLCYYAMLSWLPTILESHGMSSGKAGWMLSYMTIPSMGASLLTPAAQRRMPRSEVEVALAASLLAIGYLGLAIFGARHVYIWVTAIGLGGGVMLALALGYIVARARDHHVAHLSTMAQGVGYLVAATGPFVVGALHGLTHSWTVPLLVLLGVLVPMVAAGFIAGRQGQVLASADLAAAEDLEPEPAP